MEPEVREFNNCKNCPFYRSVPGTMSRWCTEQRLDWSKLKSEHGAVLMTIPDDYKHPDCKIVGIKINYRAD
jgi:hypothetical protein